MTFRRDTIREHSDAVVIRYCEVATIDNIHTYQNVSASKSAPGNSNAEEYDIVGEYDVGKVGF